MLFYFQGSCEKTACNNRVPFEEYDKQCSDGQLCVPEFAKPCNGHSCSSSGRCLSKTNVKKHIAEHASTRCRPNHAVIDSNCAKLSLMFGEGIPTMVGF